MSGRSQLLAAMTSWRTASVSLLSFSSGLPLGLVWIAIPDWMRAQGVDIRVVGLITLAQAPWTFKVLWSPLMDRYSPPWLGRRRGWAAIAQLALFALTLGLAGVGAHPDTPWVIAALAFAIAFASATQDIAIDAYAVDVLRPDEQGIAVGARTAIYRAAMFIAGAASITLAGRLSWPVVNACLATLYLPMLWITAKAPEPEVKAPAPATLKDAVWEPFLGFLSRPRALEILAFVVLYKLVDNLGTALLRPFLIDCGYSEIDRGVALGTVGLAATLIGTFVGGSLTTLFGLGHALWGFGFLQIFSNIGYVLVAESEVDRPLMYGAMAFESLTQGTASGAFAVLLLRMTQKRFSATQYALFSSLFGLPRVVAGPISGVIVDAVGWTQFFWISIAAGAPGLILLARFVPLGVKEPALEPPSEEGSNAAARAPSSLGARLGIGAVTAALTFVSLAALSALLSSIKAKGPWLASLATTVAPEGLEGWVTLAGIGLASAVAGLFGAAVVAARGSRRRSSD